MEICDPANGDYASAIITRLSKRIKVEFSPVGVNSADFYPALRRMHPGILIRRELISPGNYVVARLPGKTLGHKVDARSGVANQGDLLVIGPDHPGYSSAEVF